MLLSIICYSIADVRDEDGEWRIHMLDSCASQSMHHTAWASTCADTCKAMYTAIHRIDIASLTLQACKRADPATRQSLPCNAKQSQLRTGRVSRQRGPRRLWLVLSPKAPQLVSDLWRAKGKHQRRGLLWQCANSVALLSRRRVLAEYVQIFALLGLDLQHLSVYKCMIAHRVQHLV